MKTTTVRMWFLGILAVAAFGAWLLYAFGPSTATESPSGSAAAVGASKTPRTPAAMATPRDPAPRAAAPAVLGGLGDDLEVAPAGDAVQDAPKPSSAAIRPSVRPFESPAAASAFVEARVLELFAAIAPDVDPKSITKTCEPDGRICTFDGPWPADDFLKNWIRAISDGRTGTEALDGVKFSEFAPVDVGGERRFKIVAHAP